MKINYKEIEKEIKKTFSKLVDWNPTDYEYDLVQIKDIPNLIDSVQMLPWQENKWECEEIAKDFMISIRKIEAADNSINSNKAIGVAYCSRINGVDNNHTLNIIVSNDGLYLLDAGSKMFWKINRGEDEVFFIEM